MPHSRQQDDQELRKRFLLGIEEADEMIKSLSFRATCTDESVFTSVSAQTASDFANRNRDPFEKTTRGFQCAIVGRNCLMTGSSKSGNVYFKVRNEEYAFAMERSSGGGDGQSTIRRTTRR